MARPKKGTKEGDIATLKWKETMIKKYGGQNGFHEKMREVGEKGGRASSTGGFYANPELARRAGAKGGAISRRGEATKTKEMIRTNIDTIKRMVEDKASVTKISEATGVPKSTLYKILRTDSLSDYETEVENV